MTGHKKWKDVKESSWYRDTPESRAAYEKAKAEFDAKWEVECRYGNCTYFVSPDDPAGDDGWGPVGCACKADENDYALSEFVHELLKEAYTAGMTCTSSKINPPLEVKKLAELRGRFDRVLRRQTVKVKAPWTEEQVEALAEWQTIWHPFTCPREHGEESVLKVWENGWFCNMPVCDYTQDWAHDFMLVKGSVEERGERFLKKREEDVQ